MQNLLQKISFLFSRFAIFLVYFWFGALKVFGDSPANPLVSSLLGKTLPFISFSTFIIALGCFEMLIGVMFLYSKLDKWSAGLLAVHLFTTFMPLILLPAMAWQGFMTPTLEGQYIIKNILILALAVVILSHTYSKKNV